MSNVFSGTFTLVDIDVAKVVSADALEPFVKELAARQRRREKREAEKAEKSLQEAAYEAAMAAAAAAPNAAELSVRLRFLQDKLLHC